MAHTRRMRRIFQRSLCPYDDAISQLKGGLQHAPKWLDSVRKYPPSKMHLTPGKVVRPSEFWNDRIRSVLLKNRKRPEWIPSLPAAKGHPQIANIMAGAQFNDAFAMPSHASDPDIEFAACQAYFMTKKGMSEDEAYEQARFRMRDLLKQKERVWEVYRRKVLLSNLNENVNDTNGNNINEHNYKRYKNERISLTDSWINLINNKMKYKMNQMLGQMQNIHNSTKTNPNVPTLPSNLYDASQPTQTSQTTRTTQDTNDTINETELEELDMSKVPPIQKQTQMEREKEIDPALKIQDPYHIEPENAPHKPASNPYVDLMKAAEKQVAEQKREQQQQHAQHLQHTEHTQHAQDVHSSRTQPQAETKTERETKIETKGQDTVIGELYSSSDESQRGNENENENENESRGQSRGQRGGQRGGQRRKDSKESDPRRKKYGAMTDEELELESIKLYEEEKKFNKHWENQVKLLRFIEYTDYIAKNPHLGLSDPTELLKGLPRTTQKDKDIHRRLLTKMSQKQHNLKFLKK